MRFFQSLPGNPLDASIPVFPLSYFLTKSHVTLTDFKLYMSLMMNLELLILLALFGVTDLYRHAHSRGAGPQIQASRTVGKDISEDPYPSSVRVSSLLHLQP